MFLSSSTILPASTEESWGCKMFLSSNSDELLRFSSSWCNYNLFMNFSDYIIFLKLFLDGFCASLKGWSNRSI
jgi:hypothetical protein